MSNKTKELARNTVIVTIGKICTQFLNFFLLPVFTSLLTTEQYGTADLYLNYVNLFIPVLTLQLDMGLFRFLIDVREKPQEQGRLMTSALLCCAIQSMICIGLYLLSTLFLSDVNLLYLLLNLIAAGAVAMLQQAARGLGDNMGFAVSSLIAAAVQIGVNVVLICGFGWRTEAMFLAYFCGCACCVLFLSIRLKLPRYISRKYISKAKQREMLAYSIPLVPNSMCWWAVSAADRTIVSLALGTAANGLLAISHKFASVYTMGINIFVYPWTESASLYFSEPDHDAFFSSVINTMFRLFYSLCIGIIATIPFVFSFIVDEQFSYAYFQIPLFLFGGLLNTIVGLYSVVFQAAKRTRYIAITSIIAAVISVVVDISLIGFIGLYAPAVASLCSYGIFALIRYREARKYICAPLEKKVVILGLLVSALVLTGYYTENLRIQIAGFAAALAFAIIVNLGVLKSKLKRKLKPTSKTLKKGDQ